MTNLVLLFSIHLGVSVTIIFSQHQPSRVIFKRRDFDSRLTITLYRFKHWIPSEMCWPSSRYDPTFRGTLEQDGFCSRPS